MCSTFLSIQLDHLTFTAYFIASRNSAYTPSLNRSQNEMSLAALNPVSSGPFAHTAADGKPWEPLFTPFGEGPMECEKMTCKACLSLQPDHGHLNKVAFWTAKLAGEMFPTGSGEAESTHEWGYLAGLWHDLGKFAPAWQRYLEAKADLHRDEISGKVDHSTAGAQFTDKSIPIFGRLLAYLIAGHHAGLTNGMDGDAPQSSLENRLRKCIPDYISFIPPQIPQYRPEIPSFPNFALRSSLSLAFFTRFLFSCLTDADFLATEAFGSPEGMRQRNTRRHSVTDLEKALNQHLEKLCNPALPTEVNRHRSAVLDACLNAASQPPGLFSLTVPTGGGKTLSSLAFALKHARLHDLRRVIYVIPYASIIEQNAKVFRQAFASLDADTVLEHHSNLDPDDDKRTSIRSRLATENWDARLIVTTNVQFFESLHASRTSRCRKLHRLARSVIILDEAQSLPVELLQPCLRSIEELTTNYHASVVLCTATQPAINRTKEFKIGLPTPTEIIRHPVALYNALRRVQTTNLGKIHDNILIEKLISHGRVLCIVSTRRHARRIFDGLPRNDCHFHLSALMCAEHRSKVLKCIKRRLAQNQPVRVISTQLIEAGVDIDFPVVFRSLTGLDSIAQAAGRCDREGKLSAHAGEPAGLLYIFESEEAAPPGPLRQAAQSAAEVLALGIPDPLHLDTIEAYFRLHYWKHEDATDRNHILECWPPNDPGRMKHKDELLLFNFKKCAERFRLIDDYSESVIIRYGEKGEALCSELNETFDPAHLRRVARRLQRYTVSIPINQHSRLVAAGIVELVHDRFPVLNSTHHYHNCFGLHPEPDLALSYDLSII